MKSEYERKQYQAAVEMVCRDRKASTNYLIRQLQIGHTEAALLICDLETSGIISRPDSNGKRTVLIE